MRKLNLMLIVLLAAAPLLTAAELKPKTVEAFDEYMREAEARTQRRINGEKSFLWVTEDAERAARARNGEVVIDHYGKDAMYNVPGGLVHDWVGAAFIPGVSLDQTIALVQDYDNHEKYYNPEVSASRLIERDGEKFRIYYRLLKKKVITVVLNTEHEVNYYRLDERRVHSRSYTTKISEVKNAGGENERELADGSGGGYLWKLNSFWRFEERDGGVYVEMRAISLTRGIPPGLGWLIKPIVREMPLISITDTLNDTRKALIEQSARAVAATVTPGESID